MRLDMSITIRYSCTECRIDQVALDVPARMSDDVDVHDWLRETVRRVAADHRRRSPACRSELISDLAIPTTGTRRVGGPRVN